MLIQELRLQGLLSFGPDSPPIEMHPLNVLIGPNGSGKSNLIEAVDLLRSSATKLTAPIRRPGGGGVGEWIWKGDTTGHARIEAVISHPKSPYPLRHAVEFTDNSARFELVDEAIENSESKPGEKDVFFYYRFQKGNPVISVKEGKNRNLKREDVSIDESILSQRQDPDQYPELAYLANAYRSSRVYREWTFGRASTFRSPQSADLPSDRLEEDYSNLGVFLNGLRSQPKAKNAMLERLRDLYDGLEDFDIRIKGGAVEVFLTEGDFIIPANRLSDGTLRYLCLLAILSDPTPPPLVCIEEPELGFHPDMLPKLADLLVEASEKTQLIVTTHSDILIDALTETPESVVVFEKHEGRTTARRLDSDTLKPWLDQYRLGQLWTRGEIGGTRW